MIRVLIIDDAIIVRRMLSQVLDADPAIKVVGTAVNGKVGLAKIGQLKPDLVVLDLEMPVMDGLTLLPLLRQGHPRLPVVVFSAISEIGADTTLEALARGANDYCTKPTNTKGPADAMARVRDELLPKVKALSGVRAKAPRLIAAPIAPKRRGVGAGRPVELLVIGASTGGPNALMDVFSRLPADLPVPVLVVQHMPPTFTKMLAKRLDATSPLRCMEAWHGAPLERGLAYVAPGGFHMVVEAKRNRCICINEDPPENSCRPAVDPLFRSAAKHYGASCLAVIMTGMGKDGTAGGLLLAGQGAKIFLQDEATSVVWGMPGAAHRAGLGDEILPLKKLGDAVAQRIMRSRRPPARRLKAAGER